MTSNISRRGFLKRAGVVAVSTAAGKALLDVFTPLGMDATAATQLPIAGNLPPGTPIVVMIDLQGGNDFLNTLVPVNDPWYYDSTYGHGALAIAPKAALPLSGTPYGLHPSLSWLSQRWTKGDVAFVLGTGENVAHEFSHFAAMGYRNSADFSGSNAYGWLGRYNDVVAPTSPYAGVSTNGLHPSLLASTVPILQVNDCSAMAFGSDWRYRAGYQQAIASMANNGPATGMLGRSAANHRDVLSAVGRVSLANKPSYNKGSGSAVDHQLAQIAMLIDAGVPSQTYVVTTSGYDTHGSESWIHGDLLSKLDAGLSWFFGIIDGTPRAKDVFVVITSEFGRQVTANASGGCDHGQGSGTIVLGGGVAGGLYGQQPTLDPGGPTRPNRINDALVPTVDFRDVYATILNRLGGDAALTSSVLLGSFADLGLFGATPSPSTSTSTTATTVATTSTTMPMATTTTTAPMQTTTTMPPPTANDVVLDIKAPGVVFDPNQPSYTIPMGGKTSITVTVTIAKTTDRLYINGDPVNSGSPKTVWMGNGSAAIIVYRDWKEIGRYTLIAG